MLKTSSPDGSERPSVSLENHMKILEKDSFTKFKTEPLKFIIKQKKKKSFYLLMMTGRADTSLHHILFSDKVQVAVFSTTESILGKNE